MSLKHFFYFFILLLLVGVVNAIDYNVVTITDCASPVRIVVNGTLPIDPGEYMFLGCTDNTTFWVCPCNNTPIILHVQKNTINNYTLGLSYTAKYVVSEKKHRGGGGSGGYRYEYYINTTIINTTNISNISNTSILSNISPSIPPIQPSPIYTPIQPIPPIYTPTQPNTSANNTQIITNTKQPNIFQKIWAWIKKILYYKIW